MNVRDFVVPPDRRLTAVGVREQPGLSPYASGGVRRYLGEVVVRATRNASRSDIR